MLPQMRTAAAKQRDIRTEGCEDARCAQLLLSKGSPLPYTPSHLCQYVAVVASQLYVPSTRAVPSTLCVTAGHVC